MLDWIQKAIDRQCDGIREVLSDTELGVGPNPIQEWLKRAQTIVGNYISLFVALILIALVFAQVKAMLAGAEVVFRPIEESLRRLPGPGQLLILGPPYVVFLFMTRWLLRISRLIKSYHLVAFYGIYLAVKKLLLAIPALFDSPTPSLIWEFASKLL